MDRSNEESFKKRQTERFPLHSCELPYAPDRVYQKLPPIPTFWQRLRSWMQRQVQAWRINPNLRNMRPSNYTIEKEQAKHIQSSEWFVIHPMSRFWMFWQIIIIISILTVLIICPYVRVLLHVDRYITARDKHGWFSTSEDGKWLKSYLHDRRKAMKPMFIVLDFIWALHIVLKFFTGYLDRQHNIIVMKSAFITRRYIRTWLLPDVLSVLPQEPFNILLINRIYDPLVNYYSPQYRYVLYVFSFTYSFRLIRLHDLLMYLKNWFRFFHIGFLLSIVILFAILYMIFIHWCMFFIVRTAYLTEGPNIVTNSSTSWMRDPVSNYLIIKREIALTRQYFAAMNHYLMAIGIMSPTTLLPRLNVNDVVVYVLIMWFSLCFNVVLLTIMIMISDEWYSLDSKLIQVYEHLKMYKVKCRIPKNTYDRLLQFYKYRFEGGFYNESEFISHLPRNVQRGLQISKCRKMLGSSTLFNNVPKSLLAAIAVNLIEEVYVPQDVVYPSGAEAIYLYFLSIGTVAVYQRTGEEVGHLADGDFFGEMGLVLKDHKGTRIESVVAVENCQMYKLHRKAFWYYLKPMPRLSARIRAIAMQRAEDIIPVHGDDAGASEWIAPPSMASKELPKDIEPLPEESSSSSSSSDTDLGIPEKYFIKQ